MTATTETTCGKCNNQSFIEIKYDNGEENSFCRMCGYTRNLSIMRDETGAPIMQDGKKVFTENENLGHGVFFMRMNGMLRTGMFAEPLTQEEIDEAVGNSGDKYDLLYLTQFNGEEVNVIVNEKQPELKHILQLAYG